MTIEEIVKKYLMENGYDGLVDDECGCCIDDLMPCDSETKNCRPGYKVIITEQNKDKFEDLDVVVGDWVMRLNKEVK